MLFTDNTTIRGDYFSHVSNIAPPPVYKDPLIIANIPSTFNIFSLREDLYPQTLDALQHVVRPPWQHSGYTTPSYAISQLVIRSV